MKHTDEKHERALPGGAPKGKTAHAEKTSYRGDYVPRIGMERVNIKKGPTSSEEEEP